MPVFLSISFSTRAELDQVYQTCTCEDTRYSPHQIIRLFYVNMFSVIIYY